MTIDRSTGNISTTDDPQPEKTALALATDDLQAKAEAVADAKAAIGIVTEEANRVRKATIRAAHERLIAAKTALEESKKAFDRIIRAAQKP